MRLTLTPELGAAAVRQLLRVFGLPTAIFSAGRAALARVVPEPAAHALAAPCDEAIERTIAATETWLAASPTHALLTLADAAYPPGLLTITDPPPLLYASGRIELLQRPALAIVGSRSATRQGSENAEEFARALARAGITIVSGLALGIDAAAHRGALAALNDGADASTIGVVGTGIDVIYPTANAVLTKTMRERGLVISEFPLGLPPLPTNFPRRNRIIAGLARGVLVVEAALRSGSLITARQAAEQGREVFAIPGSIHAPQSKGCHRLIKDGAKLVEVATDILEELQFKNAPGAAPAAASGDESLPPQQRSLLEALGFDPVDLDRLAARTERDTGSLTADLLQLELARYIERLPGNRYQRLR
ncbi:MAG TPA: DNA-processing protein DprA [Burkholderiaceae bacterium]|nr:DNA-processing protein DprA [Burkholderiaceae bacterium]